MNARPLPRAQLEIPGRMQPSPGPFIRCPGAVGCPSAQEASTWLLCYVGCWQACVHSHITPWTWHCYNVNVAHGLWFRAGTGRVLSCFRLAGSPSSPKGCAKTPSVPRNATRHCTGIVPVPKSRRDGRAFAIHNNARAIPKTPLSFLRLMINRCSCGLGPMGPVRGRGVFR